MTIGLINYFKIIFIGLVLLFNFNVSASLEERVKPLIDAFENKTKSSGTLLIEKGSEQVVHSFGQANDTLGIPNTDQTIFLIASMSKQFTASAILRLVDKGLLSLDSKITDFFPELNLSSWIFDNTVPTVSHLLNHTGGVPDAYSTPSIKKKLFLKEISFVDILNSVRGSHLAFKPGSKWSYSNTGYLFLGEIIRRISSKSYSEFMSIEFFNPIVNTSVGRPETDIALSYTLNTRGERVSFTEYYNIRQRHDSDIFTDGNIYTNVYDLKKWIKDLSNGNILSPESTVRMFTPGLNDHGFGWVIQKLSDGSQLYWHSGSWIGYTGIIMRLPAKDVTLIWLRNQEGIYKENDLFLGEIFRAVLSN